MRGARLAVRPLAPAPFWIRQLTTRAPSRHGHRWRSVLCAVTRNEWHLREWLIRTLYVGVSHIVLIDDNHVGEDHDISALLQPLIEAGLVTHVATRGQCDERCAAQKSWEAPPSNLWHPQQAPSDSTVSPPVPRPQDDVHARTRQCVWENANSTDWLLLSDTDEYLYAEYDGMAHDVLSSVLKELEGGGAHGALVPWSMMYGEQLTLEAQLRSGGGLLLSFPRVLSVAQVTKPLGMPSHLRFRPPHRFSGCLRGRGLCRWRSARACRDGVCSGSRGRLAVLHYFQRTVESFLLKRDISLPHQRQDARARKYSVSAEPSGIRSLCSMYDDGRFGQAHDCRSLRRFPFVPSYLSDVVRLLEATTGWGNAGRTLKRPPRRPERHAVKSVHDVFRLATASGMAFSPLRYTNATAFDRARHCDSLQHFICACCARSPHVRRAAVDGAQQWMVPVSRLLSRA